MREGGTGRECRQQADDRWERMKADWKGDGEETSGWSVQSMFTRAEGQCAEERGKEEVEAYYDEREVSETSIDTPKVGNILDSRGGIVHTVHDG